jgi:KDO2-lipid IV(A) lauroyltransferase
MQNLAHTAPNASRGRRRRLAHRTFRNLASCAVDLLRLPTLDRDQARLLVDSTTRHFLDEALSMGRGVIGVTAHLGPYELGGAWLAALGYPVHAMVEDLAPETMEALALYRRATGMQVISMKRGVRDVYRLLREKQMVLLVADRAIGNASGAVELPFCSGVRPVPTGPATFAIATGAPIVVAHIALAQRPGVSARYLVEFQPPILARTDSNADDERLRLTRLITGYMSAAVQDHPDEWYVFQPQWVERDGA